MSTQDYLRRGAAALAAGVLVVALAAAQPPAGGKGNTKDASKKEAAKKDAAKSEAKAEKPDPAVEAWVKILGEKMTDRHDAVRDSARAALVALGESALPALRKLTDSDDGATATAAKRVIAQIERRERGPGAFAGGFGPPPGGGFDPTQPPMARGFGPGFGPPGMGSGAMPFGRDRGSANAPRDRNSLRPDLNRPPNPPRDERRPENPPRGPMGFGGGVGFTPPADLADRLARMLDLTDKQKDKIKEVVADHVKKSRELLTTLRASKDLPSREEVRAAVKKSHDALLEELKPILNGEQFKKAQEMFTRLRGSGAANPPQVEKP